MNRLTDELKVIPRLAWFLAVAIPLGVLTCLILFFTTISSHSEPGVGRLHLAWPLFVGTLMAASLFIFILLVGYVAGDARRRGMSAVLWTLLAIFIPSAIGFILYFMLREPLLRRCPRCGTENRETFPYCPSCGSSLASVCPTCQNAVEPGWSHCARCGAKLSSPGDSAPSRA